ncbi:MAG: ribosome biogenesis GTPase YlqF [Lactobacillus sp.]|nr:ribosome biogenesis GTPase YlqF [Lactobacillus sp.]
MATIQWYPGHMNKARNQLQEKMSLLDVLVEVLDARIPLASRNPMINDLIAKKPHIVILNKADLADPKITESWINYFNKQNTPAIAMDSLHNNNMKRLFQLIKQVAKPKLDRLAEKGASNPTIRIALCGIPNCGKSTVINRLVGKNVAEVGNRPGVTKGQSWLKTSENVQILDTPGILWPKFDDQSVGYKLAAFGAIKETIFHADDVAFYLIDLLKENYPKNLATFARVAVDDYASNPELLLAMTEKYGMRDDYDRFSLFMLQQLRKGKLGRISLDRP